MTTRRITIILTIAVIAPSAAFAAEEADVLRGRLVLEGNQRPSDWRIAASPQPVAELPSDTGVTPNTDGTFVLAPDFDGWVYVCPYAGGRLAVDSVIPVRLPRPEDGREDLELKLQPPRAEVAIVLKGEDGAPLNRKVTAHLYNVHGELGDATQSDGAGVLRYKRLPCGLYDIWIQPEGDGLSAHLFRRIEVAPGEDPLTIERSVWNSGSAKGRLVGPDGKPAAGYMVSVQTGSVPGEGTPPEQTAAAYARGAYGCYAQAEAAPDGSFELRGLTPVTHKLDVRRPGEREAWCTIFDVAVKAGQATGLGDVRIPASGWRHMLDRETINGWTVSDFYGQRAVRIENDRVVLSMGRDMTGITWSGEIPRVDYEVSLQAMRVDGGDFFCGLTFPVADDYCSLILGGWGGSVVGLSSLDGYDASENETSDWVRFHNGLWYRVRVRVTSGKIECWLDEEQIVDVETKNKDISTRIEVEPSKPFGVATWCTTGAVRDIRIRDLNPQPATGSRVGKIKPRHAREIRSSNWSVGAETMDRDYTIYRHWRSYLGPLGIKKARIQSGWAKTEKAKGRYEWAWLDEIIPDMVAQGVEPWVCLCYGNPIYEGGGGSGLGGALPSSAEALAAWDRFVAAFVDRYREHVDEWEIWNEPRADAATTQYPQFLVRTAEIIKRLQPDAVIIACATAGVNVGMVDAALAHLKQTGKLHLVNEITYHPYKANPDDSYEQVQRLRELVASYADAITIRQGENGCPSKRGSYGALSQYDWDEQSQAEWALRRLLGDLGRDIPSSYFAICDMHYLGKAGETIINYKGMLATNADQTVAYAKPAYAAVQHVAAIFDHRLSRIPDYPWQLADTSAVSPDDLSVFAYKAASGEQIVTIWRDADRPGENTDRASVGFVLPSGDFDDPVYVDLLTGEVLGIPDGTWRRQPDSTRYEFDAVPVYDSVVLIADRSLLPIADR